MLCNDKQCQIKKENNNTSISAQINSSQLQCLTDIYATRVSFSTCGSFLTAFVRTVAKKIFFVTAAILYKTAIFDGEMAPEGQTLGHFDELRRLN